MTNKDIFNTPEEEAKRLAEEIGAMKSVMRELSMTLSRIETRVKRAFPLAFTSSLPKGQEVARGVGGRSLLTSEQVLHLYDDFVQQWKSGNFDSVKERLNAMSEADLLLLREELGVPLGKKKPSRKVLIEAIMRRINESVKITMHVDRKQLLEDSSSSIDKHEKKAL